VKSRDAERASAGAESHVSRGSLFTGP
jgi:hypothetical protein